MKKETLLKNYAREEISLGKLADELGINKIVAHTLLQKMSMYMPYDKQDLVDDLSILK